MTELKTEELLKAINEIKKQISEKENEKRNLSSQKSKLENSIKTLQTEIEALQKEELTKRKEYFHYLLNYAKGIPFEETNGTFKDDLYVIFKKYDAYYLYNKEDAELIEISEDEFASYARIYELREYDDLLDDVKSDSYNRDTFLRQQRIDEIKCYYYSESLADYMDGISIRDVDLDDLLEDESNYIKGEDMEELDSIIESDEQYFSEIKFYDLKDNQDETNK